MSLQQALFYMIKQFPFFILTVQFIASCLFSKTSLSETQVFSLSWKGAVYFS